MMKIYAVVLAVLCGAALNHAGLLPALATCPEFIKNIVANCSQGAGPLDLDYLLKTCPSPFSDCVANATFKELGLDPNATEYDDALDDALKDYGILPFIMDSCLIKVDVNLGGTNILRCKLSGLVICIGQNPLYDCFA